MHASHNLGGKDYAAFVGRYNRSSPPCSALWGTGRGAIWWWCKRSVCPPCLGPIAVCNRTRQITAPIAAAAAAWRAGVARCARG